MAARVRPQMTQEQSKQELPRGRKQVEREALEGQGLGAFQSSVPSGTLEGPRWWSEKAVLRWGLGAGTSLVLSYGVQAWRCGRGQLERMTEYKAADQLLLIHVLNTHYAQTLLETHGSLYPGLCSFVWWGVRIACKVDKVHQSCALKGGIKVMRGFLRYFELLLCSRPGCGVWKVSSLFALLYTTGSSKYVFAILLALRQIAREYSQHQHSSLITN